MCHTFARSNLATRIRSIYSFAPTATARVKTFTIRAMDISQLGLNDSPGDVLDNRQHVRDRV